MAMIRVGVDIGGTFTDTALLHPGGLSTSKVLTDHEAPERAILTGLRLAAESADVSLTDIGQVIHGTTLVTNALIERRGAKTALITTEGFRDVIEMRSENRFEQYDLSLTLPEPLVPRNDRLTAAERVAADGSVLLELSDDEIARLVGEVEAGGYEAVSVGFLHAYANDAHERWMGEALREALPEVSVSLSSVVSPQMRELPRFNTTLVNAYVQPRMSDYLSGLVRMLRDEGIGAPVFLFHSGGGLIDVETAIAQPVRLLESGPAGGAIYAAGYARAHGIEKALSFDMGGTTAKICLIDGYTPQTATTFEIARTYRFKKGSGMLVSTPVVEMVEIGAGGGSIASVDAMGRIAVGPESAGSEPGPACYQRGGERPTVTDANLKLGRLDPDGFAGGKIPLSVELADQVIRSHLGSRLSLSPQDAAFGVTEMVDENMANAARVHAVESGEDIERYAMIAFGGGGPLHACRLAEKLGIDRVLIPPGAGVGSAIGFLRAPFSYEATRGLFQRLDTFDADAVNRTVAAMKEEAEGFVAAGAGAAETQTRLVAFMRYAGQGWEIPVPLDRLTFGEEDAERLEAAFSEAYRTLFDREIAGLAVEITNWSLTVATEVPPADPVDVSLGETEAEAARERSFFDAGARAEVAGREVPRGRMEPGVSVDGPAIIVEDETSTVVTTAFRAVGQKDGSILLLRKEGRG